MPRTTLPRPQGLHGLLGKKTFYLQVIISYINETDTSPFDCVFEDENPVSALWLFIRKKQKMFYLEKIKPDF